MSATFYPNTTALTTPSLTPVQGDECLIISLPAGETDGYIKQEKFPSLVNYIHAFIYLPSGDLTSGDKFYCIQLVNASDDPCVQILINNNGGTVEWEFQAYLNGSMQESLMTPETLTLDVWNEFEFKYDVNASPPAWEIRLGINGTAGSTIASGTQAGTYQIPETLKVGVIGIPGSESTETINLGVDYVVWDLLGWVSGMRVVSAIEVTTALVSDICITYNIESLLSGITNITNEITPYIGSKGTSAGEIDISGELRPFLNVVLPCNVETEINGSISNYFGNSAAVSGEVEIAGQIGRMLLVVGIANGITEFESSVSKFIYHDASLDGVISTSGNIISYCTINSLLVGETELACGFRMFSTTNSLLQGNTQFAGIIQNYFGLGISIPVTTYISGGLKAFLSTNGVLAGIVDLDGNITKLLFYTSIIEGTTDLGAVFKTFQPFGASVTSEIEISSELLKFLFSVGLMEGNIQISGVIHKNVFANTLIEGEVIFQANMGQFLHWPYYRTMQGAGY